MASVVPDHFRQFPGLVGTVIHNFIHVPKPISQSNKVIQPKHINLVINKIPIYVKHLGSACREKLTTFTVHIVI